MPKLSPPQIIAALNELPGWAQDGEAIVKQWEFDDFIEAMTFVNAVAEVAEDADHHPDIDIRYNKVKLSLSTHSEGGITYRDVRLAAHIEGTGGMADG